jgi:hypothetical protein
METEDPARAKLRIEREDPKCPQSRRDIALPNLPTPYKLMADPMRQYERALKEEPKVSMSKTVNPLPNIANP